MEATEGIVYEMCDFIEDGCDLDSENARVAKLVLDAVRSEQQRISPLSLDHCIVVGEKYWNDEASEEELLQAKLTAWQAIKGRTVDFSDPEVNLVRFLLFALYGKHIEKNNIPQDGLLWSALHFAIEAKVSCELLVELLNKYFSVELKSRPTNKSLKSDAASGTA